MNNIIPTNFNYATTIIFWVAILGILLKNSLLKKIIYSWVFAISITGLIIKATKDNGEKENIIKIIVWYINPLLLSLIFFTSFDNTKINIKLFLPIIIYYLFISLRNSNIRKLYGKNSYIYLIISILLAIFYFLKKK